MKTTHENLQQGVKKKFKKKEKKKKRY